VRLLLSSRSWEQIIFREELERLGGQDGVQVLHTLTGSQPPEWHGYARRVDEDMLAEVAWPVDEAGPVFVCGPTGLVESVATALTQLGHDPARIKTERFGPTGGRP
jgi:ferredoxin-NADP reductase